MLLLLSNANLEHMISKRFLGQTHASTSFLLAIEHMLVVLHTTELLYVRISLARLSIAKWKSDDQ